MLFKLAHLQCVQLLRCFGHDEKKLCYKPKKRDNEKNVEHYLHTELHVTALVTHVYSSAMSCARFYSGKATFTVFAVLAHVQG